MIVGIIALTDCLGPKVLNGLKTVTGRPNDFSYDKANCSAAILLAAQGDCPEIVCSSVMGTDFGVP